MSSDDTPRGRTALPQGDLRLLETDQARRLLAAPLPPATPTRQPRARRGCSPAGPTGPETSWSCRPSWPRRTSGLPARRLAALGANPEVAVTIDPERFPAEVLLRGRAAVTEVDGVPQEDALAARRYLGGAAADSYLAQRDQPGTRMARIAVRPTWVGVLDFQTRVPAGFPQ